MKKLSSSRLVYSKPTCDVVEFFKQEQLLVSSPPEVNPGGSNIIVVPPTEEEEEISGARKWSFWKSEEFY